MTDRCTREQTAKLLLAKLEEHHRLSSLYAHDEFTLSQALRWLTYMHYFPSYKTVVAAIKLLIASHDVEEITEARHAFAPRKYRYLDIPF